MNKISTIKENIEKRIDIYLDNIFHHNGNRNILKSKVKIKIYSLLGAETFQKLVFKVEKMKYIILEKFFPNSYEFLEKISDKQYFSQQKKLHYEEPLKRREYIMQKMRYRKELITKQNRNYHYNPENPTECISYLKKNKEIHIKGIIKNIVLLLIIFLLQNLTMIPFFFIILAYLFETFSLLINFECINLQNYNLERLENEHTLELLKKKEAKKINNDLKNYRECSKVVSSRIMRNTKLPTVKEITEEIKTNEQAEQLRVMATRRINYLKAHQEEKELRRK